MRRSPSHAKVAGVIFDELFLQGVLKPFDTDQAAARFAAAEPNRCVVLDEFLDPTFARACAEEFPTFDGLLELGATPMQIAKILGQPICESWRFPTAIHRLHQALACPEFCTLLSAITGIPDLRSDPKLTGAGINPGAAREGGEVESREWKDEAPAGLVSRLKLMIFFNERWFADWGGGFEFWGRDATQIQQRVEPILNRAVLFESTRESSYGFSPGTLPPRKKLKTFAAFYYSMKARN